MKFIYFIVGDSVVAVWDAVAILSNFSSCMDNKIMCAGGEKNRITL